MFILLLVMDLVFALTTLEIMMLIHTELLNGNMLYTVIVALFVVGMVVRLRNVIYTILEVIILHQNKVINLYYNTRQVEFDLRRNKRIYVEMNKMDKVFKGVVRINEDGMLEIRKIGVKHPHIIDFDIDHAITSFFELSKESPTIMVKEDYIKFLEKNNYVV